MGIAIQRCEEIHDGAAIQRARRHSEVEPGEVEFCSRLLTCARLVKGELFRCPVCAVQSSDKISCGECHLYYCSAEHKAEHHRAADCALQKAAFQRESASTRAYASKGASAIQDQEGPICEPCDEPEQENVIEEALQDEASQSQSRTKTFGECQICFDELVAEDDDYEALLCAHLFHSGCIRSWLKRKPECPTCATPCSEAAPQMANPPHTPPREVTATPPRASPPHQPATHPSEEQLPAWARQLLADAATALQPEPEAAATPDADNGGGRGRGRGRGGCGRGGRGLMRATTDSSDDSGE